MQDATVVPATAVDHLAFGLIIRPDGGHHSGFIHRIDDDAPAMVHLAWHLKLQTDPPPEDCFWAEPSALSAQERRVLSLNVRKIGMRGQPIPYGLSHVGLKFDSEGMLTGIKPGLGFTCSTFMVQVLASYGHVFFEEDTWPLDANLNFQLETLANLKHPNSHALPMHIAGVEKSLGGRRITPAEVMGAAGIEELPINFDDAQKAAAQIVAEVAALTAARAA